MTTSHDQLRTDAETTEETAETREQPTNQEVQEAFTEFEQRIASIRASLQKGGHLELVADGRFTIEKNTLISKVGKQRATGYLNDFFSRNNVN